MAGSKYWLAVDATSIVPQLGVHLPEPVLQISVCDALRFQARVSVAASVLFFLALALVWIYNLLFLGDSVEFRATKEFKARATGFVRSVVTWAAVVANSAAAVWARFDARTEREVEFRIATWFVFAVVCALETRRARVVASALARGLARAWWVVMLVLTGTQVVMLLSCGLDSLAELAAAGVSLGASLALVVTAFGCEGGGGVRDGEVVDAEELLIDREPDREEIQGYAGSSWVSRLTWQWMNPLLRRGYEARLEVDDVPGLADEDDAQALYKRYSENWERVSGASRVRATVWRSFRRQFLQTGALALVRACVMYVGPALITTFVDFKADGGGELWWGVTLVVVLALAKSVDVLASHQFSFQCTNLGMAIRSTLITVVYRKGIRLTSAARGVHGVGQIVNYMSVDVQVMSDVIQQVHNLWLLPIQVVTALGILYLVVGWSMLAGLTTMVGIVALATWSSKAQKRFQGHIMAAKDTRIKATSEALNAMKVIKLQAWETHFRGRIASLREKEYHWICQFMFQVAKSTVFVWCAPTMVSVVTFACCVLVARTALTSAQVFTAVATFRILQEPIRNFPQTLIAVTQAHVSLARLEKYLRSEELPSNAVDRTNPGIPSSAVSVQSASFSWTPDQPPTLRNIDLEIEKGTLVAVVGTVGSGKSSLLACMLGEIPKLHGKVCVVGSTAYVPQGAWIQSGSIEENILFGGAMERRRYEETLRVCALERDMELFEHGDQTEIGERGLNLSGGQKQRIQLARAVYQDCDVYLLDDIFSAVDAHTGSAIFKDCVKGVLKNKTVILVTHQIDFLHEADSILVMRDGGIVQSGRFDELVKPGTELETLVIAHHESMQLVETPVGVDDSPRLDAPVASLERFASLKETVAVPNGRVASGKQGTAKLVEEEQREIGRVSSAVYWLYLTKAFGPWLIVALLIVQTVWQTMMVLSDYWLAYETSDGQKESLDAVRFIRVYALLSFGTWLCVFARTSLIILLGVKTTQEFYLQMLGSIFRAPMAFFDTTPSGRILSRASADQSTLDVWLAFYYAAALALYFSLFGAIVVMCQTAWPIVLIMIPLAGVYLLYQAYYIATSRELTRMDSITKAPIIHHFSESIAGFMVIRCFRKEDEFAKANVDRVNQNVRMVFHNNAATEWLGYRLEMIGTVVLCSLAFLLVVLPARLAPPQLVGLSLSYGLSLNALLYWTVWLACNLENKMVCVERIHQFTKIPSEAPLIVPERRPAAAWPSTGAIEFNNLQLRYRPGTPVVLKGITLKIPGGEKVGVVGRTGSGKSTLIQALFRLVEASAGRIVIDGVDIATLGLSDLRSKFGIIPQEPTLFEGTVRANIDPLGEYTDNEIWECLRACQLEDTIRGKPEKLDSPVADDGDNWSVGQKQLFCLGRALLKRAKILVLDEATASVDAHTDWLIQKTVQEAFKDSTVISIAHRIPTVMNSNKVLVLDAGRVKEYDSPSRLLDGSQPSLFAALVKEYSTRGHVDM